MAARLQVERRAAREPEAQRLGATNPGPGAGGLHARPEGAADGKDILFSVSLYFPG